MLLSLMCQVDVFGIIVAELILNLSQVSAHFRALWLHGTDACCIKHIYTDQA